MYQPKHFFYSYAPFMEGSLRKLHAFAQLAVEPLFVQLLEIDTVRLVNGLNQPYIFVQKILCHSPMIFNSYSKGKQKVCKIRADPKNILGLKYV